MYFNSTSGTGKIHISKNMNILSGLYPTAISCKAEKSSMLAQKFGKNAKVKITKVEPSYNVKSFKIGTGSVYEKTDGKYLDYRGNEFKEATVKHGSKIEIEFSDKPKPKAPIIGKVCMNCKK